VLNKRVVVCAAIRSTLTGRVVCGARHFDTVMRSMMLVGDHLPDEWKAHEQGFIDQKGVYLSREEAWVVAREADQIKYNGYVDKRYGQQLVTKESLPETGCLFSENLY
jgi:hypothetical protein